MTHPPENNKSEFSLPRYIEQETKQDKCPESQPVEPRGIRGKDLKGKCGVEKGERENVDDRYDENCGVEQVSSSRQSPFLLLYRGSPGGIIFRVEQVAHILIFLMIEAITRMSRMLALSLGRF